MEFALRWCMHQILGGCRSQHQAAAVVVTNSSRMACMAGAESRTWPLVG